MVSQEQKIILHDYWNIENWPLTNKQLTEYSKINDTNIIHCSQNDIRHYEKLLLMEFEVLRENRLSGDRYITHKLHIIRAVKEGNIFCGNPLYINIESMELDPIHKRINKRISSSKYLEYSGRIFNGPLYTMFKYHPYDTDDGSAKYTVRIHEDELLNDIRTKRPKSIPSLVQLCFSAIPTNDLEQYNYIGNLGFPILVPYPRIKTQDCL
jgi:hypothetical protein